MKPINCTYTTLFVFIVVTLLSLSELATGNEPAPPAELGGICADDNSIYNLTKDIQKSPWKLDGLYAVPVGTQSPETWDQSSQFNSQFISQLQSEETAYAYAQACATVWQNYFAESADVIVTAKRTITTTNQVLQCVSGTWVLVSTQNLEFQDISDWQTLNGSPFDVMNPSSQSELEGSLQAFIDSLNAQPGASSDPE